MRDVLGSGLPQLPKIVCLYTGTRRPEYCQAMPRRPAASVGLPFDDGFVDIVRLAIERNPSNHDGAVLIGRAGPSKEYHVSGWSFRLFPPALRGAEINRGAAFNSCLAMSKVPSVDAIYLFSSESLTRFKAGRARRVA